MENPVPSLRSYLTNRLLTSLYLLWLVSTVVGYFATINYANQPYDMVLLQRAQAVADQLKLGTGHERLEFVPELPDGSDPVMPDRLVYTVSDSEGRKLAGTASLSTPLSYRRSKTGAVFNNGERGGERTRTVSLVYPDPASKRVLQLHVSETTHQRQALIRGILANIVIPQLLLILLAVAAVWYGLKKGLLPLERLRNDVATRARGDLDRLDEARAPAEVRPLLDAVNDLLERLKQVMSSQQRFVADAAHQLRTPLAGLKTQVELALREDDPLRKQRILEYVLTSAKRTSHLINQLLMLARNEPGGQGVETFLPLDLDQAARDCTLHWVPFALEKDIDLGFEEAGRPIAILGDADSLGEMLGNLIDNAIRYTPRGGVVTVSVRNDGYQAVLQVLDNGPGIPPEHRPLVFDRFYRVLGSGQSGSGLGLAIVAEVAKRHDAELLLESGNEGAGSRFEVRFPLSSLRP
jgi:two-component system sensor histidine kinase TctE